MGKSTIRVHVASYNTMSGVNSVTGTMFFTSPAAAQVDLARLILSSEIGENAALLSGGEGPKPTPAQEARLGTGMYGKRFHQTDDPKVGVA